MATPSIESTARGIAVAISAGRLATRKEKAAAAIQDRYKALTRAISRKSAEIQLGELESDPASEAQRMALATALQEHGASKSREIITIAKELLAFIKGDEDARIAVGALLEDAEKTLIELADVEGEDEADVENKPARAEKAKTAPRSSTRELSSQRLIPPEEPSKTELERTALPIWKRTDRFFMKAGIVVAAYLLAAGVYWFFIRTPANEPLERCRNGDRAGCWLVVGMEDAVADGEKVSAEPLQKLCDQHQDPCGCVGLAYVKAATDPGSVDCDLIKQSSKRDPKWACACTRYNFWRAGQQRTAQCGVPTCDGVGVEPPVTR
jgi:hypothetical protein